MNDSRTNTAMVAVLTISLGLILILSLIDVDPGAFDPGNPPRFGPPPEKQVVVKPKEPHPVVVSIKPKPLDLEVAVNGNAQLPTGVVSFCRNFGGELAAYSDLEEKAHAFGSSFAFDPDLKHVAASGTPLKNTLAAASVHWATLTESDAGQQVRSDRVHVVNSTAALAALPDEAPALTIESVVWVDQTVTVTGVYDTPAPTTSDASRGFRTYLAATNGQGLGSRIVFSWRAGGSHQLRSFDLDDAWFAAAMPPDQAKKAFSATFDLGQGKPVGHDYLSVNILAWHTITKGGHADGTVLNARLESAWKVLLLD